jgi:hypothetical protein
VFIQVGVDERKRAALALTVRRVADRLLALNTLFWARHQECALKT